MGVFIPSLKSQHYRIVFSLFCYIFFAIRFVFLQTKRIFHSLLMLMFLLTVWKESNATYLNDVLTNPLDVNSVPVNCVNVNVTNNGEPINQCTNSVNKDKDGIHKLLEDCDNSSKSSEADWESTSTILSILVTNPCDFELNKKPSGICDNQVFTLNWSKISVDSAKADDNGSYISKGDPKKYYHEDLKNAPHLACLNKNDNCWTIKERDTDGYTYINTLVSNKDVYEIKWLYMQNKNNPWLTQTIIQVKWVTSDEYLCHYLVQNDRKNRCKHTVFHAPTWKCNKSWCFLIFQIRSVNKRIYRQQYWSWRLMKKFM